MEKKGLFLFFLLFLGGALRAQIPMPLSNGSFEQWSNHQGYSVRVLILNVPVYSAYTTPTGWGYPTYPVNETVSLMGMNININTSVPLIVASRDTAQAPDSSSAVKLQSFMISDIVSSTVLNVAGSSIDSSLTQQVIPSILTTGQVDLVAMIPLITNLLSGTGDIMTMLPSLLAMDVNDYITGGIALNGYEPSRLTGSYKYQSAVGGDNGGVILVGTRYNTSTHQRDIVGLGYNIDLVDTGVYTPFSVEYQPLSALVPGTVDQTPDSLIVALVSSANANLQQGSMLWIDNLMLWQDTCADITGLTAVPAIHEAVLSWSVNDTVAGYEIEYGTAGFTPGTGTTTTTSNTTLTLTGLAASTQYDAYVRAACSNSLYGNWSLVQFTTADDTCATVLDLTLVSNTYDAFPEMELQWRGSSQPDHWRVEYGPQGFALGTGTVVETEESSFAIYELERLQALTPNTWYDFYVTAVCGDDIFGEWDSVHYRTFCANVDMLTVNQDEENLTVTPNHRISGYSVSWTDTTDTRQWGLTYGIYNPEYPDLWGTHVTVDTPYFEFPPLAPESVYTVMVSALCGDENYGDIVMTNFTTIGITGIDDVIASAVLAIRPNPAHGQCEVTLAPEVTALSLYSIDGRLLDTQSVTEEKIVLHLPAPGVFMLHVTTPRGTSTHKIVNR